MKEISAKSQYYSLMYWQQVYTNFMVLKHLTLIPSKQQWQRQENNRATFQQEKESHYIITFTSVGAADNLQNSGFINILKLHAPVL